MQPPTAPAVHQVVQVPLGALQGADYNPRIMSDEEMERLERSIEEFGFVEPAVARKEDLLLVGGHQRTTAMRRILARRGHTKDYVDKFKIPVVFIAGLSDERAKTLNVALNKIHGEWDQDKLQVLLAELAASSDAGLATLTGFSSEEVDALVKGGGNELEGGSGGRDTEREGARRSLAERFGVPPFTVLDSRQGYWQDRKRAWLALGIDAAAGREHLTPTMNSSEGKYDYFSGRGPAVGGSLFDPVLCELVYRWFCPPGGTVLDPFAGECTKGVVSEYLGHPYTGIELRAEQVNVNRKLALEIDVTPNWVQGDSALLDKLLPPNAQYDLVFTSPPYYDLEVYSEQDKDGSAFETYDKFLKWYRGILKQAVARLRTERFVVLKVGEVRNKRTGAYRDFVGDTSRALRDLGLHYYNEAVLVTPGGSAPLRAGFHFSAGRKLEKVHQNVLVYYKGDLKKLQEHFKGEVEAGVDLTPDVPPET